MGSKAEYEAKKAARKADREAYIKEHPPHTHGRLDHDPEETMERCFELAERFVDALELIASSVHQIAKRQEGRPTAVELARVLSGGKS